MVPRLEAASPCTTWVVGLVAGRVEWLAGALRWVSWGVEETGAFRCNGEYDGTGNLEYTGILWDMTQSLKLRRVHSWKKINSSLEVVTLMLTMKQFLNHSTDTSGWTISPSNKTTRNYAQRLSHGYHPNTTPTCSDVISVQIAELWQLIQINVPYPLMIIPPDHEWGCLKTCNLKIPQFVNIFSLELFLFQVPHFDSFWSFCDNPRS